MPRRLSRPHGHETVLGRCMLELAENARARKTKRLREPSTVRLFKSLRIRSALVPITKALRRNLRPRLMAIVRSNTTTGGAFGTPKGYVLFCVPCEYENCFNSVERPVKQFSYTHRHGACVRRLRVSLVPENIRGL